MNIYNILAVSLAFLIYIYMIRLFRKGDIEQNLATWLSWVLLDVVAGLSLYVQGGNWPLLVAYVVGGITIVLCIVKSAKFDWGNVEKICFALVIICIVLWKLFGPQYATVVSTIGVAIAFLPQAKDVFLRPEKNPVEIFTGFTVVNALATVAGKSWTIEERLYPAVCTSLCIVLVVLCFKKYFPIGRPRGA